MASSSTPELRQPPRSGAAATSPLRYMPQLDGLRAIAVIAVWFEHWGFPPIRGMKYVEWGPMGVWLFFVLSGFLITQILLQGRAERIEHHMSGWQVARIFYARRFLRILPIYYLTLVAMTIVLPAVRPAFWWHFTYTTNFWSVLHPHQFPPGSHFWTLAVEEQFYLLWPCIILLVPSRWLLQVLILAFAGSLAFRYGCSLLPLGHRGTPASVMLPGCVDKFALGGLLAWFWDRRHGGCFPGAKKWFCRAALVVGLPGLVACEILRARNETSRIALVLLSACAALFFTWLIDGAARGFRGAGKIVLEWRPVLYLGKISYSLYLFHYFVPFLFGRFRIPEPHSWAIRFMVFAAVTIAAASLSWYGFERPINGLKRYFTYGRSRGKQPAAQPGKVALPATSVVIAAETVR